MTSVPRHRRLRPRHLHGLAEPQAPARDVHGQADGGGAVVPRQRDRDALQAPRRPPGRQQQGLHRRGVGLHARQKVLRHEDPHGVGFRLAPNPSRLTLSQGILHPAPRAQALALSLSLTSFNPSTNPSPQPNPTSLALNPHPFTPTPYPYPLPLPPNALTRSGAASASARTASPPCSPSSVATASTRTPPSPCPTP